jgi:DNA polymerase-3 subunit epsilon
MGSRWHTASLLVFDTESTGTNPKTARIIEVGGALFEGGPGHVTRFTRRLQPGEPIPPEATQVHGITDEDVANEPRFEEVAHHIAARLLGAEYLAGYNACAYDVPLINAEFERAGQDKYPIAAASVIDVCLFVRWGLRHLRERKLSAVCAHFEIPLYAAHSAAADAEATGRLLYRLADEGLLPATPESALQAQRTIAPFLDEEFARFSYWLYQDRGNAGLLRLGCGKHCGRPLDEIDPAYLSFLLDKVEDLPPEVRRLFGDRCGRALTVGGAA